jgi:hypothetical protein
MTSLLALVPRPHQVVVLIESLMNLHEPSAISTLQPPEWLLEALTTFDESGPQVSSDVAPETTRVYCRLRKETICAMLFKYISNFM